VICADADLDLAAYAIAFGAFATAGQRCSSTSRCVVRREALDAFAGKLVTLASRVQVGHWQRPDVFMGPLISDAARASFLAGVRAGEAEGAEALRAGAPFDDGGDGRRGFYVRPSVHLVRRRSAASRYQREELFGPDVALYPVDSDDEALAAANDSRFGLCASVFTRERRLFDWFAGKLEAGVINWNSPTVGASGKLPFGGVKDSGNHRPAGIFSALYCAWPAALSFTPQRLDEQTAPPGLPLRG
jgi:succinylglutamic semialdehyde dehydrogenase